MKEQRENKIIKSINPLIILAAIVVIAAVATYIVPAGVFDRVENTATGYDIVNPSSFHYVENTPIGIFDLFKSITLGLQGAGNIIFFLLIIGGVFQIVEATGALHAGISNLVKKTAGKQLLLIPLCMAVFSLVSATAACSEEYLAFVPLVYVVCVACGFDSITAVAILFCSSAVGYAGGMTNAFTVGVAQNISEIPLFSGIGMRTAIFTVLVIITIIYVMIHARNVKINPQKNVMYELDHKYADQIDFSEIVKITKRQKGVLLIFALGFIAVAISVIKLGFYIDEMSAIFVIIGMLCAIVGGLSLNDTADAFVEGCKNLIWAGLIIGFCKAATNIMSDANIMDTLISSMASVLKGLPSQVSACGMFIIQDLFNFIVPSGSGQAAITMPFMAPLADLLGLTRQVAVLAFQLGDAFTNVITPTSGSLMAALAICHIPYKSWIKFMLPLWGMWCIVACAFLIYAATIGYMGY